MLDLKKCNLPKGKAKQFRLHIWLCHLAFWEIDVHRLIPLSHLSEDAARPTLQKGNEHLRRCHTAEIKVYKLHHSPLFQRMCDRFGCTVIGRDELAGEQWSLRDICSGRPRFDVVWQTCKQTVSYLNIHQLRSSIIIWCSVSAQLMSLIFKDIFRPFFFF